MKHIVFWPITMLLYLIIIISAAVVFLVTGFLYLFLTITGGAIVLLITPVESFAFNLGYETIYNHLNQIKLDIREIYEASITD